tara:strand:+ start:1614 stop:1826 length:213 start_codon:yes stop_codon:yes gene_type:complete
MKHKFYSLFLHHMMIAGLMMDGNPGVWRAIRQMDKSKEIEHVRSIQNTESVRAAVEQTERRHAFRTERVD